MITITTIPLAYHAWCDSCRSAADWTIEAGAAGLSLCDHCMKDLTKRLPLRERPVKRDGEALVKLRRRQ